MKFDIARKIVKFNNGTYGVRRWTPFGYQFLGIRTHAWLPIYRDAEFQIAMSCSGTKEDAHKALQHYLAKPSIPMYGKGRPVSS